MAIISFIAWVLYTLLFVYTLFLLARLIFDWIPIFNRQWRPRGAILVVAEVVYTVTDPPLRFVRRFIKPVPIGGMSIDFGFAIVMFLCFVLLNITRAFASV